MSGFIAIIMVLGFFSLFLVAKRTIGKEFCVLCASVTATWVVLLIGVIINLWADKMVIGVLMGTSLTGAYYFLESKVDKEKFVFKLPFFITGLAMIFSIVSDSVPYLWAVVIVLWMISVVLYLYRSDKKIKSLFYTIVECCKKW